MKAITFNVNLLEPLLINDISGGDPNTAIGLNFIPGSVIRGALIASYVRGRGKSTIDACDPEFRQLFLEGSVRYLNAYLLSNDGSRTLPTPFSLHVIKDVNDSTIHDFAIEGYDPNENWVGISQPFCNFLEEDEDELIELFQPLAQVGIHIFRGDRQKVSNEQSTIFRYQSLDAGQKFQGVIVTENESYLEKIKDLLPHGTIFNFGKSHLAGYGRVLVTEVSSTLDKWEEYSSVGRGFKNIAVTLLSDAIIRDKETGNSVMHLYPVTGKHHKKAFVRKRIRGGFNRTWNLPIPQALAIQAGSVFVYKNDPELFLLLKKLAVNGIGEKKEEGFGRIAVNWNQVETILEKTDFEAPPYSRSELSSQVSKFLSKRIVERVTRQKIDQALIVAVNNLEIKKENALKNTQISRMRGVVRDALHKNDSTIILHHLEEMKEKARNQFEKAQLGNESLCVWISSLAENPQTIWFKLPIHETDLPSLGEVKPELNNLALEYTVRLIDAVLHKASKEGNNE